jgi:hypothetical protein
MLQVGEKAAQKIFIATQVLFAGHGDKALL